MHGTIRQKEASALRDFSAETLREIAAVPGVSDPAALEWEKTRGVDDETATYVAKLESGLRIVVTPSGEVITFEERVWDEFVLGVRNRDFG